MAPPPNLVGPPSLQHTLLSYSVDYLFSPKENPCIHLFYSQNLVQDLPTLLPKAWKHNPYTTLKVLFSLQSLVSKEAFTQGLLCLYHHRPLTLVFNLECLHSLGCIQYLLDVLCIIVHGPAGKKEEATDRLQKNGGKAIKTLKRKEEIANAKNVVTRFANDANYRLLHNQIASFFAVHLEADLQFLASGKIERISSASRLCPSLDSYMDKRTLLCEAIARMLFPRGSDEYKGIEEAHYCYRIRDRLRKDVLVPLRRALLAGAEKRSSSVLPLVKSQKSLLKKGGRKLFKIYLKDYKRFNAEDNDERFGFYLEIVDKIRRQGDGRSIHPCKIIKSLDGGCHGSDELAAIQWQNLIESYKKSGRWKDCLAICNVSSPSRRAAPAAAAAARDFSIGVALLFSELCQEPWKGKICTFSTAAKLQTIEGTDLRSKVKYLKGLNNDENHIRFSSVFDQILQCAVANGVSEENMIRKIFVFSDTSFAEAANNFWGAWADIAKYKKHGYKTIPEIIYWDVREGHVGVPETSKHKNFVMIKGFSKTWATLMFEKGVVPTMEEVLKMIQTPEALMHSVLSRNELHNLVVFD